MKSFKDYSKRLMFSENRRVTPLERKLCHLWWGEKSNTFGWDLKPRSSFLMGFTLIELILVLVIMGLLTSLVIPAITSLAGLKLKATARKVAAGLRYARSQAVTTGSDYQVVFNLGKGEITIESLQEEEPYREGGEQEEAQGEEEEGVPQKTKRKKTYKIPKEVKIAKVIVEGVEITEDDDEEEIWIDFYPNGSCSGGEIFLTNEREREYRIILNFLTGIVEIKEEEES